MQTPASAAAADPPRTLARDSHEQRVATLRWRDVLLGEPLLLAVAVGLSLALSVEGAAFIGSDWSILATMAGAHDHTIAGLVYALGAGQPAVAPVQRWYLAVLYSLLSWQPLGYWAINSALLLGAMILAYFQVRQLQMPRLVAVAVPAGAAASLGFAVGGNALGDGLALLLGMLGLYAEVRAMRHGLRRYWCWKPAALVCLAGACLSSPTVSVLLVAGLMQTIRRAPTLGDAELGRLRGGQLRLTQGGLAVSAAGALAALVGMSPGWSMTAVTAWAQSVPGYLWDVLRDPTGEPLYVGLGALTALLMGVTLWRASSPSWSAAVSWRTWLALAVLGVLTTGIGAGASWYGRPGAITAAGLAMAAAGSLGLVAALLPTDLLRREVLSVLLVLTCAAALVAGSAALEAHGAVYRGERAAAASLVRALPRVPPDSTILIEPACPSAISALAMRSPATLPAIMAIAYHDPTDQVVVLGAQVQARTGWVTVGGARRVTSVYLYSDRLFIYDEAQGTAFQLRDAAQAARNVQAYSERVDACH
ncbi:MAG: hypothetical protein J2P38_01280 [Candidatus Dormibacteraeota bacterium]|nr:hypothetical protein [Candidatus Dormibacteraeota bacterium]